MARPVRARGARGRDRPGCLRASDFLAPTASGNWSCTWRRGITSCCDVSTATAGSCRRRRIGRCRPNQPRSPGGRRSSRSSRSVGACARPSRDVPGHAPRPTARPKYRRIPPLRSSSGSPSTTSTTLGRSCCCAGPSSIRAEPPGRERLRAGGAASELPPVMSRVELHESDEVFDGTTPNIGVRIGAPRAASSTRGFVSRVCRLESPRPSAGVSAPPPDSSPRRPAFRERAALRMRRNTMRNRGWTTRVASGMDGCPAAAPPSLEDRATCSTIWLGDHLPGAHGVPQAGPMSRRRDQLIRGLPARRRARIDLSHGFLPGAAHPTLSHIRDLLGHAASSRRIRRRPISTSQRPSTRSARRSPFRDGRRAVRRGPDATARHQAVMSLPAKERRQARHDGLERELFELPLGFHHATTDGFEQPQGEQWVLRRSAA